MSRKKMEPLDSPLEEILEQVDEPQPPAGLRDRCLSRIRELAALNHGYKTHSFWRPVLAAAGVGATLTVLALLFSPIPLRLGAKTPVQPARKVAMAPPPAMSGPAAREETSAVIRPEPEVRRPRIVRGDASTVGAPAMSTSLPGDTWGEREVLSKGRNVAFTDGRAKFTDAALVRPWRDESKERQKVVHQELEVAVSDVEEGFDRATGIVERAGGWTENEELSLGEDQEHFAYFTARVPIDKLRHVVRQLRDLGEVVSYRTERDDATTEYHSRGADIRAIGAEEEELVKAYLEESNRRKKQALYQQIMSLRERNRQQKQVLRDLSHETHFAYLDVTLTEQTTPLQFLSGALVSVGKALAWIAATAVIWLPLLVLGIMLWRRNRIVAVAETETTGH